MTESAEARATAGAHKHVGFHPFSPDESTAFEGTDGDGAGAAEESLQPSDNNALEEGFSHENHAARGGAAAATVPAASALGSKNASSSSRDNHDEDSGRSSAIFARLWAEVIGDYYYYDDDDDACAAFPPGDCHNSTPGGGAGENRMAVKKNSAVSSSSSSSPQQSRASSPSFLSSSSKNHRQQSLDPWERLVAALREDRGVDVSRVLTAHEHTLLRREVADWLHRARGDPGRGGGGRGAAAAADGQGKGMAARLAAAATAALNMKDMAAPAAVAVAATPRQTRVVGGPRDDARGEVGCDDGGGGRAATESAVVKAGVVPDEINPAAWSSDHGSGQRLSVGGFSFPAVVVEGEGATPATNGRSRHLRATAGEGPGAGAANGGPQKRLERQLDLRGVVLDAHEVIFEDRCVLAILVHMRNVAAVHSPPFSLGVVHNYPVLYERAREKVPAVFWLDHFLKKGVFSLAKYPWSR